MVFNASVIGFPLKGIRD
jgi:hypothetical protein